MHVLFYRIRKYIKTSEQLRLVLLSSFIKEVTKQNLTFLYNVNRFVKKRTFYHQRKRLLLKNGFVF